MLASSRRIILVVLVAVSTTAVGLPAGDTQVTPAEPSIAPEPVIGPEFSVSDPIYSPGLAISPPVLASAGDGQLAAWWSQTTGGVPVVKVARVASDGQILDPAGLIIGEASSGNLRLVAGDDQYLLIWTRRSGLEEQIVATRLSVEAQVLDEAPIPVVSGAYRSLAAAAWNGRSYLVLWRDSEAGGGSPIVYGARISADGDLVDDSPILVSTSGQLYVTDLASHGEGYMVLWWETAGRDQDVFGQVLRSNGRPRGEAFPISTLGVDKFPDDIEWNGEHYFATWTHGPSHNSRIFGARITPPGVVLDPDGFEIQNTEQGSSSSIAWGGSHFLLVYWIYPAIWAIRLTPQGTPLGDPVAIADVLNPVAVDVSAVSAGWMVAWNQPQTVWGAAVDRNGQPADAGAFPISLAALVQGSPAVSFSGQIYLAVWLDASPSTWSSSHTRILRAARVTPDGRNLDGAGFIVSSSSPSEPAVAWNGSEFLVVWRSGDDSTAEIRAARVSEDGEVMDPKGIQVTDERNTRLRPQVAGSPLGFLVVWQDHRETSTGPNIYAARLGTPGDVLDPHGIGIATTSGTQATPAVTWNGQDYIVVWGDERAPPSAIDSAVVHGDGTVMNPQGFVSEGTDARLQPFVASDGTNALVTFRRRPVPGLHFVSAVRLGPEASPIGQEVDVHSTSDEHARPQVVWDGLDYVVAWVVCPSTTACSILEGDILAARVSPLGRPEAPFVVPADGENQRLWGMAAGPDGRTAIAYTRLGLEPRYGGVHRAFVRFVDETPQCTLTGTIQGETLTATQGHDIICALAGNDTITGLSGHDIVYTGLGDDVVNAGYGEDILIGGPGNDSLNGGPDDDRLFGERGVDFLDGGRGTDLCDIGPQGGTVIACEA